MEKRKAFTLIELMGVLVIIGILTVILVPVINNTIKNNKQKLHDNQIDMIRLSAQNLATDNTYILPEEDGEEIYITLGQLRAMGYAEGTIIDPLTNENFSDNLIVMIIKKGNDYDYVINLDGGTIITSSGIIVGYPSKKYIREGVNAYYIITAKTASTMEKEQVLENYINIGKENIKLLEVGETDEKVRYKLDGSNGLYKLTVLAGKNEGYLYFSLNNIKDYEGKEVDVLTTNDDIKSNKKILVDNTRPTNPIVSLVSYEWKERENNRWYSNKDGYGTYISGTTDWTNPNPTSTDQGDYQSGIDYYEISKDGQNWERWNYDNSSLMYLIIEEGIHYRYIRAIDKAGNISDITTKTIKMDNTAPTAPVVTLVADDWKERYNNTWYNYGIYVAGKANPDDPNPTSTDRGNYQSGIDYYEISKDGQNWERWNYDYNSDTYFINTAGETYKEENRYIRAVDKAGNISDITTKSIKIDRTAPTCNWEQNWAWTSSNVTVKVYGTDSGSGMSDQNSKSWTYSGANEEINTAWLAYTIKDNAGNEKDCSGDVSVKHDTLAPRANCWWAGPREGSGNQFSLQCSVSDSSTVYTALGYCYQYNDSTQYWTCSYKNLEDRYNGYGWRAISDYYFGFNISLKNDVNTMDLKIGFKDEAGNMTGPWPLQKKA